MKCKIWLLVLALVLSVSGMARAQYAAAVSDGRVQASAYVQHGQGGQNRDWHCGGMSYTRAGYAHAGTDLAIPWTAKGVSYPHVPVKAGVRGKVIASYGDCSDVCATGDCICANAQGTGNFVKIEDRFGRVRVFMHLRKGSVHAHAGDAVDADTLVGEIGSSGYSTGPHLHDEFRDGETVLEPFAGDCATDDGYLRQVSLWNVQGGYGGVPSSEIYACSVEPGRYADGYHDATSRRAFQWASGYLGYAKDARLGCPSSFVHDVAGVEVQDFAQDDKAKRFVGSDDGQTALLRTPGAARAYLVHSGFWGTYKCLPLNLDLTNGKTMGSMGGTFWLGAPLDNEHRPTAAECLDCDGDPVAVRQNFERGYLSYRSDGVIRVHLEGQSSQVEALLASSVSNCGASLNVQGNPPSGPQATAADGRANITFEWLAPYGLAASAVQAWGYAAHPDLPWKKLCDMGVAGDTRRFVCTFPLAHGSELTFALRFIDAHIGERWVFDESCAPAGGCGRPIGAASVRNGTTVLAYDLAWNGQGPSQPAVYFNGRVSVP